MEKDIKRHSYTASYKLQVIKYAEEHGNRSAERHFGPPPTERTIRLWRSQQDVLCKMNEGKRAQRGKSAKWPELEADLFKWVQENRENGVAISTKMMRMQAVKLARERDIGGFKGGDGWCCRFMKRRGLSMYTKTRMCQKIQKECKETVISIEPMEKRLLKTAIGVNLKASEENMDSCSLSPSSKIKLEPPCSTDHVDSSDDMMTIENPISDLLVSIKIEQPEIEVEYPDQDENMDSCDLSPSSNIKLEPPCKTDHVGSSAQEMTVDDQVTDMIDSNLPLRIKIEQPEIEVEYSDHDEETASCSQNVSSLPLPEEINSGNRDFMFMKPDISYELREDKYQIVYTMVEIKGCSSDYDTTGQNHAASAETDTNDAALLEFKNWSDISESESSVAGVSNTFSTTINNCQLKNGIQEHGEENPDMADFCDTFKKKFTELKLFKCDDCGASFSQAANLKRHQRIHTGEKPYKCDDCGASFCEAGHLKLHRRTHTGEKPYKCDECGALFTQTCNLKMHKKIHTGEKPYKCDDCGASFSQAGHLKRHKRKHTGEKPYKCEYCGASFCDDAYLKIHERTHTGEKPYKCDDCGALFACNRNLNIHKRVHSCEKYYKCDDCGGLFTEAASLKVHRRIHTGEKPYICDDCGTSFTQASTMRQHMRTHTGEKPYKCDICGACMVSAGSLKTHKRTHTGEKPYKCDECGALFTVSSNLKLHKKTHRGEKPHKCDICGKYFTEFGNLKKHRKLHTGERPYKCDDCGATFSRVAHVKTHKMTHTGERPHKCDDCGASFSQGTHLISHKRIHTGEKPYKCGVCGCCFMNASKMKRHQRGHVGEKVYKLADCCAIFAEDIEDDALMKEKGARTHTGNSEI